MDREKINQTNQPSYSSISHRQNEISLIAF